MRTYELKIMAQKAGKKPARLGFFDVEAESEQEALDIGSACANMHYDNVCATLGKRRDETTRIWVELV